MKINFFLFLLTATILFNSCEKEVLIEDDKPFFRAQFEWGSDFLSLNNIANPSDSLPAEIDISWEHDPSIEADYSQSQALNRSICLPPTSAMERWDMSTLVQRGQDTFSLTFLIKGKLEVKTYDFPDADLLDLAVNGPVEDIPIGTVIPLLGSGKSQAAGVPLQITTLAEVDFSGSSFVVTDVDTETVSGNFTVNFKTVATEDKPQIQVLEISNGEFYNAQVVRN